MARWTRCVSTQGNLRGVAIQATDLIQELADLHKLDQQGAQGLGEAAIAALLLGSYLKPGERVNLNIQGSGHYRQALTEAWPDGRVRGFITQRPTDQIAEEDLQSLGP